MKILNPSEYKSQNPSAYLGDYLTYLEDAQKEAEKSLENAKDLLKDNSIIASIQKQAEEIFQMAMLVEEYMGHIILKSVDSLTLEELQSYFDFDEKNRLSEEDKKRLEEEQRNLKASLEKVEGQISDNLYLNGRVKDFYEIEDVADFFLENVSHSEFLEGLLDSLNNEETSENSFSELNKQIKAAIECECKIQNVELSSDAVNDLCKNIMDFFRKCKNILYFSPEAKDQLAKVILSESGIKQILPDAFDSNTAYYLIDDLMNSKKLNTAFYSNLPVSLQEKLVNGRLHGKPYDTLFRTYQAFLKGEELPSDDLSQEEKEEKRELEEKIDKVKSDLASLDAEKNSQQDFLVNEEAMRSDIKQEISASIGNQVSAKDIDSIIKEEETKTEELKRKLLEASGLLSKKSEDLNKAQSILLGSEYHYFFQSVEHNNVYRLYKAFGVNYTEEVISPFLEEEKKRYEQLDILINLQNKLSDIYNEINTKKNKANFITKHLPQYKESIRQLEEQYNTLVNNVIKELKDKGLLFINVPQISNESTIGNVIVLPPNEQAEPTDFSELSNIKHTFWNMSKGIDENTKQRFLASNPQFDNWEDLCQDIMQRQSEFVGKLFSFHKGEDGYYIFESTKEEREQLKHLQTIIIEMLSSIYDERKAFRQSFGDSFIRLDDDKVEELEYFLGHGANLSRENLANYIDKTKEEINSLKALLMNNRALCVKLGVELPEDILNADDTENDNNKEIDEKIQALNIDGITNLDEAIAYRNLLLGLEEYNVPPEKVKQYYYEHKNK